MNCRFFPIDPKDLADRDLVDPGNPCGYSFPETATRSRLGERNASAPLGSGV